MNLLGVPPPVSTAAHPARASFRPARPPVWPRCPRGFLEQP